MLLYLVFFTNKFIVQNKGNVALQKLIRFALQDGNGVILTSRSPQILKYTVLESPHFLKKEKLKTYVIVG